MKMKERSRLIRELRAKNKIITKCTVVRKSIFKEIERRCTVWVEIEETKIIKKGYDIRVE
jgi:hypothetical protein